MISSSGAVFFVDILWLEKTPVDSFDLKKQTVELLIRVKNVKFNPKKETQEY